MIVISGCPLCLFMLTYACFSSFFFFSILNFSLFRDLKSHPCLELARFGKKVILAKKLKWQYLTLVSGLIIRISAI